MTTDIDPWLDTAEPDNVLGPRMPRDVDAERVIAASVMERPELVDELAAEGFDPADITTEQYRWVWFAVEELRTSFKHGEIRWLPIARQLQAWHADGHMPVRPLSESHLAELYHWAQPSAAAWHAERVAKKAIAARIVALGHDATGRGNSAAFDPDTDVAALQEALDGVTKPAAGSQAKHVRELIGGALERCITPPTKEDRVPTGFMDLDALLCGGWAPGQMVVIGARPAMGKSTIASGFARAAAVKHGVPTLFHTLEMSEDEITNGLLCAEARIALHHLKQGIVDNDGVARAAEAGQRIAAAPLFIDDVSNLTLPGLRAKVRHHARADGLRLVIVDYLQLMTAPKAENRQNEVSKLSRGIKLLAREFGITVIILAQLNRGPEQRQDKRPTKSDLRESGSIEQDADIVILLHRDDAYERESPRAGEADLIVDKHRGGQIGTVTVAAQLHYASFVDMAVS
ncbi:replicative DNA helicase [Streptomyces sp. SID8499]|uniref:DnaB-like helicase C-terminal domain-containing protein n=1 Tax=Streptomyces sp. SID8499 TaxID=2706106 RepID=UPI0013C8A279|nr:replicative DNA helicase [Streptomyces sp. SID8499]